MTNPWIEGYPTFRQNQHVSYLRLLVHAMQKLLFLIINSVANPLLTRSIATRYKQQPLGIDYQPLLQSFVRDPQTSNKHINVYQRDNINKILGFEHHHHKWRPATFLLCVSTRNIQGPKNLISDHVHTIKQKPNQSTITDV